MNVVRARRAAIVVLAAVLLLPAVFVAGIYVFHPRNEAGFMAQIDQPDLPTDWAAFVEAHDKKFFLTEGDRACDWLGAQPLALIRSDSRWEPAALLDRYLATTGASSRDWIPEDGVVPARRLVASSAWNHLCEATLLVHRPYHPFSGTDDE